MSFPHQALVKANGLGLGFDLCQAEFELDGSRAHLRMGGLPQPHWAFHLHRLPCDHYVAVARAPPSVVVDAWGGFKRTFGVSTFTDLQWEAVLEAPEPSFAVLPVSSLVPVDLILEFEAAGGDVW